jgi:hypothetical protein
MYRYRMSIDLDINNYEYEDLLRLFKLSYDFDVAELKEAKKIVLKMHPDKSHLGPEYFRFFSNAYKTIINVYEFKNKTAKTDKGNNDYINVTNDKDDQNGRILGKFLKDNKYDDPKKFNKWFNEQFDKLNGDQSNQNKEEEETNKSKKGYGDWLRSEDGLGEDIVVSKDGMGQEFSRRKKELKGVIRYEGVQEVYASCLGGSVLYGDEEEAEYGSGLFDRLSYVDVKKAHTETVMAVDEDDYDIIPKFKTIGEYQRHRDSQRLEAMKEADALKMLREQEGKKEEMATRRAYYYAKEVEKNREKEGMFWAGLKRLL